MKLLRFLSVAARRGIRLTLDVLLLSLDFCRLMLWLMWSRLLMLVGRRLRNWGPYCRTTRASSTGEQVCPAARKYGTLAVFRLLCPYVYRTEEDERFCTFVDAVGGLYSASWARLLGLGASLTALWLAAGVVALSLPRSRPLGPRLSARLRKRLEAPAEVATRKPVTRPRAATDGSRVGAINVAPARGRETPKPRSNQDAKDRSASPELQDDKPTHVTNAEAEAKAPEFVKSGDRYFAEGRYVEALIEYTNAVQRDRSNARARLGLGLSYLRGGGRVREARNALLEAVRLDPTLAEAHAQLCRAELAREDTTRAIEHARQLKEVRPDDPEGYVLLSACHEAGGDWDAAQSEMEAATALAPATADTFFSAGSLYWRREDLDRADAAFRRALELDHARVDARVALAGVLRLKRDLDSARQEIDAARKADPGHAGAAIELAEWHAAKGQVKEAIATYEQLVKDKPELHEARARWAWLLVRTGRTNDGVAAASALVREERGHVLGHFVLAATYHAKGFHDVAIDHCEQGLATDRGHVQTRVLLARCRMAKQRYDEAVRELKRVLNTSPKHSRAQMLLAKSYMRLAQHDKAKECYEKVAKENPAAAMPYLGLARVHVARGLPEGALLCYEEALKRAPGDPLAANNLVMTLVELGRDLGRARQLAADVRKRFPESPIFADTYGWVCYHRGEYQKAVEALAFAAKRRPRRPDVRYHYGMALYKGGNTEQAKEELAAALELSPEFEGAGQAKATLTEMSK